MRSSKFIMGAAVGLLGGILIAGAVFRSRGPASDPGSDHGQASSSPRQRADGSSGTGQDAEAAPGAADPALPSKSSDRGADGIARIEQGISRLEKQQAELKSRKEGDRMIYAAGLPIPNNPVTPLYEKFTDGRRNLEAMIDSGMGRQHPQVSAQDALLSHLLADMANAVDQLEQQMQTELDANRQALQRLRAKP